MITSDLARPIAHENEVAQRKAVITSDLARAASYENEVALRALRAAAWP